MTRLVQRGADHPDEGAAGASAGTPGKVTRTEQIQRKASGAPTAAPEQSFAVATSGAQAEVPYRSEMEGAFGQSFGGVSAHLGGPAAAEGLGALGARAAASGESVAFAEANPSRELVAHELTYVVQSRQAGGDGVARSAVVSSVGDDAEREADEVAATVAAGGKAVVRAAPSAALHRQPAAAPGAAGAPTTVAGAAPAADIRELHVRFTLPGGRLLSHSAGRDVKTRDATHLTIGVTPTGISVHASPPIFVDVTYPANNLQIYGAHYTFGASEAQVDVSEDRGSWGFLDFSNTARTEISTKIMQGVAGTPARRSGYNPMTDPDVMGTLNAIADNFRSMPSAGGGGAIAPGELGQVAAGGTFATRAPIDVVNGGSGVKVPAGGSITVDVQGAGSVGAVAGAGSLDGAAAAASVQSISITSEDITLLSGGKPAAQLHQATIHRGGQVTVGRVTALGSARTAEGIESLLRLLVGAARYSAAGVGDEAAIGLAAGDAEARIVPGITRAMIEDALTAAAQTLIRDNADAIPGLDLAQALGLAPAAAPARAR